MFSNGILSIPTAAKQKEAVTAELLDAINNGTFTYTELLSTQEPFRTMALEILDGVTVTGSKPTYGGAAVQDWGGRTFRLVHVSPTGRIKMPVTRAVRIPGSLTTKQEKHWDDIGNIADVNDHPHTRQARYLLQTKGWPVRQTITNGNTVGEIVEWEWLVQEAARGEAARPGCVELHREMAKRIAAWEEVLTAPPKKQMKPNQPGGDARP